MDRLEKIRSDLQRLQSGWLSEDDWFARSDHNAQTRWSSWRRANKDIGLADLYGEWKGQMATALEWCDEMEEELLEEALGEDHLGEHPEEKITDHTRELSEVAYLVGQVKEVLQRERHLVEGEIGEVPRQIGDLAAQLEEAGEIIGAYLEASREALRTNPLLVKQEEQAITYCLNLYDRNSQARQALQDLDGAGFLDAFACLIQESRPSYRSGDPVPELHDFLERLSAEVQANEFVVCLQNLPIRLIKSRMNIARQAKRLEDVWRVADRPLSSLRPLADF